MGGGIHPPPAGSYVRGLKTHGFTFFITVACVLTVITFFSCRLQLLTIFNFWALTQPLFE